MYKRQDLYGGIEPVDLFTFCHHLAHHFGSERRPGTVLDQTSVSYTHLDVYKRQAVDTSENESVRSEAATFTTLKTEDPKDTEAPTVPANVRTSDVTETTAKVAWDEASDNVGVVGYNVYVNETKVNDELVTGTEYDLTGLTEETEYTVNVTAVDAEGNESVRSEAVTFTTLKTEEPADTEACLLYTSRCV